MANNNAVDVLNEFTKEEIIQWIRKRFFILEANRRDLLFIRWDLQSQKLRTDYQAEIDRWDACKPDFKKRDDLVRQFQQSTDANESLQLLEQITTYDKPLKEHMARIKKLDARQEKLDLLYRQLDEA